MAVINKNTSIRNRFLAIIVVFFSLFSLFALYTDRSARIVVEDSQFQIQQMQEVGVAVSDISNTLHLLGIAMYQSTFFDKAFDKKFDKKENPENIPDLLNILALQISDLNALPSVKSNPEFSQPAMVLFDSLSEVTVHAQKMLDINADVEMKYPAMPIIVDKLRPINQEMTGLISNSIDEAQQLLKLQPEHEKIQLLFRDLRYVWSQLVSSVRVFVANRLGAFGPPDAVLPLVQHDQKLYSDVVADLMKQLQKLNEEEALGFVQQSALSRMFVLHSDYQRYFDQAADIYLSENWRADKTLLRNEIDPALDVAWTQVYLISSRINVYSQMSMEKYASTADLLSKYIWVAITITMGLLLLGYRAFDCLIRRPLISIADALVAEGKGDSRTPELKYYVKETNVLLTAFDGMRDQIRSRQARLQSVLDNAGEGILTFSMQGKIESANKAACSLFGFSEDELVKQDVTLIIPDYMEIITKLKVAMDSDGDSDRTQEQMVAKEQEVDGRSKDGHVFSMSLRLGKATVENDCLITALVSDISERKNMIERLTQLAERDSLTGLYNRHFLMDELERIVVRSVRGEQQNIALLYIDLDHFKFVNDTLGHIAGDKVLQEVTGILQKRARGTDLVTRLGGDEFAIVLYDIDELQAKTTASAYRKQLADYVFRYEGKTVDVGCSIGVVLYHEGINKKEEILSQADLACHLAKQSGRNRVHLYTPEDQQDLQAMSLDMGWSRRIKSAIENNDFFQFSQPIVDVTSGDILSHEVLLRLADKKQQLIMPSGFLPSAARFGLSVEVDKWVIKNTFQLLSEINDRSFAGYSVNLSSQTVDDESTLSFIENQMHLFSIDPTKIIFEVTETSAINRMARAATFLGSLQQLGFQTALDDFGEGYSSFTYLKDLPVDYVKLDGSFVKGLGNDHVKIAIVKSMNEVAHALGKKTVAEFVEDAKTLSVLREIGVDYCQGFYTGKPVSVLEKTSNIHYLHSSA